MLPYKNILIYLSLISNGVSLAGTMGPIDTFKPTPYIKLGSGGSYSMSSHINPSPIFWDSSPEGYSQKLSKTAVYSSAFGYNYSPLISTDIEFIYRPAYEYSKFQTSTDQSTTSPLGNKTRRFNFESNSLMGNVYLHGTGISNKLKLKVHDHFNLEPFLGGGAGVSFNTVSNFNSLRTNNEIASLMANHFNTSFAWQLSAGVELLTDCVFNLAAGYRYYNGGRFDSNNYLLADLPTEISLYTLTPWSGQFQANEFFVTLSYKLDA